MEAELESDDSMESGDDMSSSEEDGGTAVALQSAVSLRPRLSAVRVLWERPSTPLSQGSAPRARTPPVAEKQSGRGRHAIRRCHWHRTPLHQAWRSALVGWGDVITRQDP